MLDCRVSLVISGLEFAIGAVGKVWLVMKAAVSQRTAEAFMKEEEQERNLEALGGQTVGIATTVAFYKRMPLQFAEIVAKLVQSVGFGGKLERSENSFVDLFGGPAADGIPTMQKNLQYADHPHVVDFNAGIAH